MRAIDSFMTEYLEVGGLRLRRPQNIKISEFALTDNDEDDCVALQDSMCQKVEVLSYIVSDFCCVQLRGVVLYGNILRLGWWYS